MTVREQTTWRSGNMVEEPETGKGKNEHSLELTQSRKQPQRQTAPSVLLLLCCALAVKQNSDKKLGGEKEGLFEYVSLDAACTVNKVCWSIWRHMHLCMARGEEGETAKN